MTTKSQALKAKKRKSRSLNYRRHDKEAEGTNPEMNGVEAIVKAEETKKAGPKSPPNEKAGLHKESGLKRRLPTLPRENRSTIGVSELNFSVRNGKRWNLTAITT